MAGRNLTTDFSTGPYFDDYDETKKFLRILFRPSFPVQARELTQLQTILNNQIGRFGQSIYKDGTTITGGNLSLSNATSLKLNSGVTWDTLSNLIVAKSLGSGYSLNDELLITGGGDQVIVRLGLSGSYSFSLINNVVPSGFFGKIATDNFNVTSGASGAQFEVNVKISLNADPTDGREERPIFHVQGFSTETATDAPTLYGEYLTGTEFAEGDELYTFNDENGTYGTLLGTLPSNFASESLLASVLEGIFFTNNFFALIDQQTTVVSKYETDTSLRIGFNLIEDIVTEREDESLLDNAAGSPNENAPGAHRFKIRLQLGAKTISETLSDNENFADESFYEIGRVKDGEIQDRQERPQYSVLGDELAKRMYDVNGNFVVEPFKITFEEKVLWTMDVTSHTRGTVNLRINANRDDLTTSDFTNKVFTVDDRIYSIVTATKPPETADSVFDIELANIPNFVLLQGESIRVIDRNNFSLSFTSGQAYVGGRRFSTIGTTRRDLEKTRTASHLISNEPRTASVSFGNYIVLTGASLTAALGVNAFQVGSIVNLYADDNAAFQSIGTARIKQLKKGPNNTLELYYFETSFASRTITADTNAAGSQTINLTSSEDIGVTGATFTHNGTRYKIVNYTSGAPDTVTLNTPLVTELTTGTNLTLNYSAVAIKSVEFANDSNQVATISESIQSDIDNDTYVETRVLEGNKTKLVFPISDFVAKDISSESYRYIRADLVEFENGVGIYTPEPDEALWPDNEEYFIQITAVTSGALSVNDIVSVSNIEITDPENGEIDITDEDATFTGTAIVSAPISRFPADPITTALRYGNTYETTSALLGASGSYIEGNYGHVRMPAAAFATPGEFKSIGLTGVIRIRGIYELDGSETTTNFDSIDATERFNVDLGQRDGVVDHTKIALKPGYAVPTNDFLVVVDRLKRNPTPPLSATYYNVDSYEEIWYDILPTIRTSDNQEYDLRKVVDFRPRASELADGAGTDLSTFTDANKTYSTLVYPPHADNTSTFQAEVSYYVGRRDKVTITPDLDFKLIQGTPAEEPEAPGHEDRSLSLYDITQSSYSSTQDDIETLVFDNRRYTMNDISIIEERLTSLEKSVQLDKVEKAILSSEIKDANNTNLFKTGVFVDSFSNASNAEVTNSDYLASIDTNKGELRPAFDQYGLSLDFDSGNVASTAKITEDNVLFPQYSDTPVSIIDQVLATRTENVNPFAVMDWIGELKLNPERDFWRDVVRKPDVVTNLGGTNAAWSQLTRNASRTDWNSWETKWAGWNRRRLTRTGIRTTVTTRMERKSLGDSIVDQSVIPLMRPVPGGIRFRGISMKANTIVYPFFDDQDIIEYVRPAVIVAGSINDYKTLYENTTLVQSTVTINGESATLVHKSKDINNVYFHIVPDSRTSGIYDLTLGDSPTVIIAGTTVTLSNLIPQKISGSFRLKTGPVGTVAGIFDVPEATFKTGSRNFKLIDSSTGEQATASTSAEKDFEASGLRQTVQENIVSTRTPTVRRRSVRSSFTSVQFPRWRDPLAQTFLIDGLAHPNGVFIHSIDLWIVSRDPAVPITLQIRPVNNGYPDSQLIIPFGEVHLDPEDVNVTETPNLSNYTRFTFSTPVFLDPGEYSFVVMANSVNYEIYTALIGEEILDVNTGLPTTRVMNEQPFSGVMFKSQNASTWSAYQEEDIMFRINRVNFTPGTYQAVLNATFDKSQLAALAPFKDSDIHFNYDDSGNTSKFSYNLFRINVPQIRDFDNIVNPTYRYKPYVLTESTGSISQGAFRPIEVNETAISDRTFIVRENQPDSFQVELTFGTNDTVVAPYVDAEQMNAIFIQNLVDEAEMERDDITIVAPGSGYTDTDSLFIYDVDSNEQLGQIQLVTVSGAVTDFTITDPIKYATNDIKIVTPATVTGSGLELKAQSEVAPTGGVAEAKYISRRVTLKAGFESQDIKVTLSAYRPEGTRIYVYYKVRAAEDTDLYNNKPWNLMYELSNPNEYSTDREEFLPLEFVTYKTLSDGSIDPTTKGGSFYTYEGTTYESFNMYSVKVIMTSDKTYQTPVITDLGAIALITPIEPQE